MSATATLAIKIDATAKLDGVDIAHDYKYKTIMTSITQFSSAMNKIRDILRLHTPSIVNEQSSNHICLYILARYLTIEKCTELKIPLDFAWENIVKQYSNIEGGKQRAYDLFYSPTDECFIKYLDEIFGTSTEDYPFKIKELEKHKQIIELIDKIDMDRIDIGIDPIGFVYEDEFSHSKGARKNGEHFTDRSICNYMTKLVHPKINKDGVPESVCDPSMGTGGFLYSYVKFFDDTKNPINWKIHGHRIYGQDVINSSVCKAKMNMYTNTNTVCENLILRNSLTNDLQITSYDIILANIPFAIKGIKHAECCERVKALKIRGTKSEPLFLQLIMVSLNMGGRCAVIVPNGMLTNDGSLHINTRKYLLDHFELKRVIQMKGKFFLNTTTQTSILFFENTGKSTNTVEFWEVVKGNKGEITETMVASVSRTKITSDASYSFEMRRYIESEKSMVNPGGFPRVKLEDYIEILGGKRRTVQEAVNDGKYDFITCSIMGKSRINVADFHKEAIIINSINGSGRCRPYYSTTYSTTTNNIHFTLKDGCKDMNLKYLYYYLELNIKLLEDGFNGGNQKKIGQEYIKTIQVILPPLPIQQEIVAMLDKKYKERDEAMKIIKETDSKAHSILESYLFSVDSSIHIEESKEHVLSDSTSPINEFIHPEESAVVASTESHVKKVVKRKKPVVAKSVLGNAGVITHEE